MHRRTFLGTATAAVVAPPLAGCSGGDGEGSSPDGDGGDGGNGDPPDESPGMAAYPDYDWEQLTRADAAETDEVTMAGSAFRPLVALVPAGTEVTFANEDAGPHTVTIPALDVDERVSGGESTTVTVEAAGTYDYVCTLHPPSMLGRLVVEE